MGDFVGPRLYSCYRCRNQVCLHDDIISKAFQGRHGRAFLLSHGMNIVVGAKEDRHLMSGLHTVADISCGDCSEVLGWKYERAYEASQKYKEVVPVLFQHSLRVMEDQTVTDLDHIFTVEPMKISSPSSDAEVALALRVLEGCCLLHCESTILAHQHKAITVLMNILSMRGVLEQGACLDALIAIMLDSSSNQMDFEACNGIEEVALLIRDKQVEENLRLKCGELLLLIGHVTGREAPPMMTMHEEVRRFPRGKIRILNMGSQLIRINSRFRAKIDCFAYSSP